jgi:polysaccharide export outer membrane protein
VNEENGSVSLPVIGEVSVAGLRLDWAEDAVRTACVNRGYYRAPHVTVTMKQQRMNKVTVIGGVEREGIYELPRGNSDLVAAIVAAGGLAKNAGTEVEIRNPGAAGSATEPRSPIAQIGGHALQQAAGNSHTTLRVDLVAASRDGAQGFYVEDGGIVRVERREPQPLFIMGLVNKPGRYEFPVAEEVRVLDAIALASGAATGVADKVYVIRRIPDRPTPIVIQVSLGKAKKGGPKGAHENVRLAPGDVVSVEHTPATVIMEVIHLIRFGIGGSLGTFF